MEYRSLFDGGPPVSVLGFGAWPIGGGMGAVSEKDAVRALHTAIDGGMSLIDTAEAYNDSESLIGRAITNGYRGRCFLATKVSYDLSPEGITTALENSLRKLGTDAVDLYQVHAWKEEYPIDATMECLARLQEQGKIRFIGVSNFNADQMEQARKIARFHTNQTAYNLFRRGIERKELPYCARHGIGFIGHSPLDKGLLTGKYGPEHTFPVDDERSTFPRFQGETFKRYLRKVECLKSIAAGKGLSLVQLAVGWTLRRSEVRSTLVGAKNEAQVTEHLAAADTSFTADELERIDQLLQQD